MCCVAARAKFDGSYSSSSAPQPAAKNAAATAKKIASAAVMIHSGLGPLRTDVDASTIADPRSAAGAGDAGSASFMVESVMPLLLDGPASEVPSALELRFGGEGCASITQRPGEISAVIGDHAKQNGRY